MNLIDGLLRYAEKAGMTAKKAVDKAVPYLDPTNPVYDKIPVLKQTRELSRSLGYDPAMDNSIPFQERLPMYLQKYGEGFMGSHGGLGKAPSKGILPNPIAKRAFQLANEMDAKGNISIEQTDEVMQMVKDYLKLPEKQAAKMTIPQMLQELTGNADNDQMAAFYKVPQRSKQPNVAKQSFYDTTNIDDFLANKLNGSKFTYPSESGMATSKALKIGDNNIRYQVFDQDNQILMPKIYIDKKNTGLGSQFMETMKEYADSKGKPLVINNVENPKFFDKFPWLKYEKGAYRYSPARVAQESLGDIKDFDIPNLGQSILNVLNKNK